MSRVLDEPAPSVKMPPLNTEIAPRIFLELDPSPTAVLLHSQSLPGSHGPHGRNASHQKQASLSTLPDMLRQMKDTSHKEQELV